MSRRFLIHRFCLLLLMWVLPGKSATLDPSDNSFQFRSRLWTVASGHPQNSVQAVVQGADGFLWLGTQHGLVRFDGHEFYPFEHEILRSEKVNALAQGPDGSLWIGTASAGVFRIRHGQATRYPLSGIADKRMLSLHVDPDGTVWGGTVSGLLRLEGDTFQPVMTDYAMATNAVRAIARMPDGVHWFAFGGQTIAAQNSKVVRRLSRSNGVPSIYLRTLLVDETGALWIGSNSGLSRWKNGKFVHFSKADGLPDNTVSALFQDSQRRLWVGTYSGLCRKVGDRFKLVLSEDGEPFDQVFSIAEDHEQNLWAGCKDGLVRLHEDRFKTYLTRHGLGHNNVISVLGDSGGLWIGTWGGGLHWFKAGELTAWSRNTHPILKNDLILALHKTKDGTLWIGTDYDGGLYRLEDGKLTMEVERENGMMRSHAVRDIHEDRNGNLWIATSAGVLLQRDQQFTRLLRRDGLGHSVIRCIAEDAAGAVWIGTEGGLSKWNGTGFENSTTRAGLPNDFIHSLYADNETNLWIGTATGLARWNHGQFVSCTNRNPLLTNAIVEMVEDPSGFLWLSSYYGIIRVKKSDLLSAELANNKVDCELFGEGDGMISSVCVGVAKPAAWATDDGRLWFATTRGVVTTDSRRTMKKNAVPPAISITRFQMGRRSMPLGKLDVELEPGSQNLEFNYTALSFRDPEKNRFKYQLVGFDTEWVDAGVRRSAFYNNLPPGNYTFRVIGCNNDGVWNEEGASVRFKLRPAIWQTSVFQTTAFFGMALMAAVGTRHLTRKRMQVRLKKLEQEHALEKERIRIARDVHDDLGARITEILLVGKQALQTGNDATLMQSGLRRMCDAAQEIATDLNAIVFAVNPKNDTLEHLVAYICKYVEKYVGSSSLSCRLNVPLDVPDLPVSSELRHHVVMCIKEALNNALKHSEATELSVVVAFDRGILSVEISDNGKGFVASHAEGSGNGLESMKKRMSEIGAGFTLASGPGKGTRIQLKVPLKS